VAKTASKQECGSHPQCLTERRLMKTIFFPAQVFAVEKPLSAIWKVLEEDSSLEKLGPNKRRGAWEIVHGLCRPRLRKSSSSGRLVSVSLLSLHET